MTLREVWLAKEMNSVEVAAKAKCSVATLYKLNRKGKDEDSVTYGIVKRVCDVLELSPNAFAALTVCPMSERYKQQQ